MMPEPTDAEFLVERGIVPACCAAEAVEVRRQLLEHQLARITASLN